VLVQMVLKVLLVHKVKLVFPEVKVLKVQLVLLVHKE